MRDHNSAAAAAEEEESASEYKEVIKQISYKKMKEVEVKDDGYKELTG